MARRDIIVIGASAGGVEALQRVVRGLPADLEASVFVTVHFPPEAASMLPRILSRAGSLSAVHAAEGDAIVRGRIYVAPPDQHLLLHPQGVRLSHGPRENGNRPAIDPMFRSAALAFGPRVVGVVLTGALDDGTAGLKAVKRCGGTAVVQDPADALFAAMPRSAIDHVEVDRVVPLRDVASTIARIAREALPPTEWYRMSDDVIENEFAEGRMSAIETPGEHPGRPSAFGCPDCGGVLWELQDGELSRYRCRVGHAWSADALLARQAVNLDDALWTALRTLEERASLARRIAAGHRERGSVRLADRFESQRTEIQMRAEIIRLALERRPVVEPDPEEPEERRAG